MGEVVEGFDHSLFIRIGLSKDLYTCFSLLFIQIAGELFDIEPKDFYTTNIHKGILIA